MANARAVAGRVKARFALLLEATGALSRLRERAAMRGRIPVLALHRVGGSAERRLPLAMPESAFRCLVAEASQRYRIGSWAECLRASRERDPRPHLALTFDDGYRDAAEVAWPILRQHQATAVFCVTTAFVDGVEPLWWEVVAARHRTPGDPFPLDRSGEATYGPVALDEIERLKTLPRAELRRLVESMTAELTHPGDLPAAMRWSDVERMAAEGAEFAGHSVTHPVLMRCDVQELAAEIGGCRAALQRRLQREITLFAYPNGDHDPSVVRAVHRAGFRHAFAKGWTHYAPESRPLAVPRIPVRAGMYSGDDGSFCWPLFEAEILGVFDRLLLRRARGLRPNT